MDILKNVIDLFLHLDHHIGGLIASYGHLTYGILFAIIFAETGLVVTPFLPGDSLLFILGTFAAKGSLRLDFLLGLLMAAAFLGDVVNYSIGRFFAKQVVEKKSLPFIKRAHIEKTEHFYAKYGPKTLILARFVPIVRTFAPFMAGVGKMPFLRFISYSILGGSFWVSLGLCAGYFFGNLPWVEKNFSLAVLGVVVISLIPIAVEIIQHKRH